MFLKQEIFKHCQKYCGFTGKRIQTGISFPLSKGLFVCHKYESFPDKSTMAFASSHN